MAKRKPIYAVFTFSKFGIGMQPVKADGKREARAKFKKRNPKKRIETVCKINKDNPHYQRFATSAF